MKLWHHIVAGVVGLSLAGLIVFLVFGNASREGAVQDGSAPEALRGSGETLCGSIEPSKATSATARKTALANPPAIIDPVTEREITIPAKNATQRAWLARVHAASGFCIDEVRVGAPSAPLTIAFSTTSDISDADAAAFVGGAIIQAYALPLRRDKIIFEATIGESERTVVVTGRTLNAFIARRRGLGLGTSVTDLQAFQARFPSFPLVIRGW